MHAAKVELQSRCRAACTPQINMPGITLPRCMHVRKDRARITLPRCTHARRKVTARTTLPLHA
jgi:hypothetical protein